VSVINHINKFLCEHGEVGRYATMFFGLIDRDGRLEYIKAGHPSPLLLRHGQVSELYNEGSFPVGLLQDAEFTAVSLQLEPDDTLILFSDGITDAENPDEELYGISRLREALAGQQNQPLEALKQTVLDSVEVFSRGANQSDDMTLLIARYRALA
jgi:sigma-B regulation protein RsbU (phosphoserine phosphatase)